MKAGLVLAAGGASRFGAPKQLALLDGRPLVAHAVSALLGASAIEQVTVVLGAHADAVEAVLPGGVDVVRCEDWQDGMAASLRAGIAALPDADWVLVSLADQPRVSTALVAELAAACEPGWDAVRPAYDGVPGNPVALGRALLARAHELRGDAGFRPLLTDARVREVEVGHLGSAADVDTPADLEALAMLHAALRVAVLTVSTGVAGGDRVDRSGPLLARLVADAGLELDATDVVSDDTAAIAARLRAYAEQGVEVVLTTGGTGLTPDDVTPEATREVIDRELPGVASALVTASLEHTPMGMLSRGICGVAGRTLIINFPGSPRAVEQLFPVIAPVLGHAVAAIAGRVEHKESDS